MEREEKRGRCGDRWRDQNLVMFLIYTSVFTANLANKNERQHCPLSIPAAIRYRIFDHFKYHRSYAMVGKPESFSRGLGIDDWGGFLVGLH